MSLISPVIPYPKDAEWLEADGLGGFASGTVSGIRTRRYHAIFLPAMSPPSGRVALVNGFDAWVETSSNAFPISSQNYSSNTINPRGMDFIKNFSMDPWPTWVFELPDGSEIKQEIFARHGSPLTCIRWKRTVENKYTKLIVRPFFSGRDYHGTHHENDRFNFHSRQHESLRSWKPYENLPEINIYSNGSFMDERFWYKQFEYVEEKSRGLDDKEDLAVPGRYEWNIAQEEAVMIIGMNQIQSEEFVDGLQVKEIFKKLENNEVLRRRGFSSSLNLAADAYLVRRGKGKTIIAGYPWFTDWGRDTFISIRGICLATGRLREAQRILIEWATSVSEGMLPNLFVDAGGVPEYNAVDASLWFIVAVYDFFESAKTNSFSVSGKDSEKLWEAIESILKGYSTGTRYGIKMDSDGLLCAGASGSQLTWMDAKVGDWVVTPRSGKPVEVQALWINALWIGSQKNLVWKDSFERAKKSFGSKFWNEKGKYLFDVIDVNHVPCEVDGAFRPNQIFAIGGLPLNLLDAEKAKNVVKLVEEKLWTPMGLRTLSQDSKQYVGYYQGGVLHRDGAYHQGTVWPWLNGAFVEAWLRVHGNSRETRVEANKRFVLPLKKHLLEAGINHVSEIADGDPPFSSRGCPFQAWSLGELIRAEEMTKVE